jgi:hypothetical protein
MIKRGGAQPSPWRSDFFFKKGRKIKTYLGIPVFYYCFRIKK